MRRLLTILALTVAAPVLAQPMPPVEEQSVDQLRTAMMSGRTTSAAITRAYLARIAAMDRQGPSLRAVIAINPDALVQARASDARRRAGRSLGPLDGVPLLIKDNIETADPMPTTAGSLALKDNMTRRDAPVIARLRAAGAVILGKTNLSEWANIRSTQSMSGWSAVGGLVRNPYALDRTACGSSSGTGAGVAASFAAAGLGTETDGSVVCPSAMNGLVGLKPTLGAVSRTHVVPISHSQDTPGPMARTVRDAAILFAAMTGTDRADVDTREADAHRGDYLAGLTPDALRGVRVAVLRPELGAGLQARYAAALDALRRAGAVLVDVPAPKRTGLGEAELLVLQTELRTDLDAYLATTPPSVPTRTLDQVIAFDTREAAREMPYFAQETFVAAAKTKGLDDPAYKTALDKSRGLARAALDGALTAANATIIVTPSYGAAWPSDPIYGDQYAGISASELPAVSGYPHLTVPMGAIQGLPVGLSFIGKPWTEAKLLAAGYAFEQATHARIPPRYRSSVDAGSGLDGAR